MLLDNSTATVKPISRRHFLKSAALGFAGIGLAGIGGRAYIRDIEPRWLDISHVTLSLPRLPAPFVGLTIAQISDLHMGEWMTAAHMMDIVQQVNMLQADLVVITGDFISALPAGALANLTSVLKGLSGDGNILGVLGNHDHWVDATRVRHAVEAAGTVQLLFNEHRQFQRENMTLYVAGVDDIMEDKQDLAAALVGIPEDACTMLLAHEPDFATQVSRERRVVLQLSGHSHGGQVRVPGGGALILPELGRRYEMGLYDVNGMQLYVNRGVGMVRPYVRFNCRPEITHFTLMPA